MIGFDGQTETIQDTYKFNGSTSSAPSTTVTPSPTTGTGEEYDGGVLGDTLYLKDYLLVKPVYMNNMRATKKSSTSSYASYWIASRYYGKDNYGGNYFFDGRYINTSGNLYTNPGSGNGNAGFRGLRSDWYNYSINYSIRPIITVRSGLYTDSGKGSLEKPYRLNTRDGWFLTNDIEPLADQKSEYWENGTKIMNGWRDDLTDRSGRPNTYYFKDGYVYKGWLELDGNKYYLSTFDDDGNGYMDNRRFNGETREIDGVEYTFDANGVCTNCD